MPNKRSGFNWKLPLYGAMGFGTGFTGGIFAMIVALFGLSSVLGTTNESLHDPVFIISFAIGGALGIGIVGAALGWALNDKKKIIYLACAGAIGGALGALGFLGPPSEGLDEDAIRLTVIYTIWSATGLAIWGAALGWALNDKKKIIYLACAGAIAGASAVWGITEGSVEDAEVLIAPLIPIPIALIMLGIAWILTPKYTKKPEKDIIYEKESGSTQRDVFISAKSADYKYARQLYDFLTSHGISTFFSEESLPELADADFRREIDRALDEVQYMIVVVSSAEHARSPWVEAEWGFFVNEKRSGRKKGDLITLTVGSIQPENIPPGLRSCEVMPFGDESFEKILSYVKRKVD
ncbi:MAG: hypothetical protein A7315_07070 [Candidatus Altiarchaeales archaeon WOR_SM1_79]|nr:MAG: hypothetical protein A7315_07070 [Candidatus Altiarchaeales archaeon WOR_SM1_79]